MTAGLFRKEVTIARQQSWLGTIRLQAPRLGWACCGLGLSVLAALLGLLAGGHYTRHARADGVLVPTAGLLPLAPTGAGVVTRLLVREGDPVRAGQPLLEISAEQDSAALGATHAAIATQLGFKRERLQADLAEQARLAELQQQDLRERLGLLRRQVAQMDQQMALQKQRADSADALYRQWSALGGSGVVSRLQLLQQHDAALQNQVQFRELSGQALQLRQQVAQLQGELEQLPAAVAARRNDTERQLADVAQALSQNAAQRAMLLRAPADGVVAALLVRAGAAVSAQQTVLNLLPAGSELQAELWVPARAVGFMHAGEPVVIRYPAYPYQAFGTQRGRVLDVSRSALSPAELSRLLGQPVQDARYRVRVALARQSVRAYGRDEALRPGMTLDADVQLDRRSLREWVLAPLAAGGRGAVGQAELR